jgi:type IX secretion system PorP/SprF family membrane protein
MKKYSILFVCMLFAAMASAQQDPQFSQNLFNNLAVNPGYTGSNDAICATALHRSQWMGVVDAPVTTNLGVEAALPMIGGGLGLNVMTDAIGKQEFMGLKLSYAYRLELAGGTLGLGASVGMLQDGVNGADYISESSGDVVIPNADEKAAGFDFGAGLFYRSEKMYFGFSSTHVNEPLIESSMELIAVQRHYYLTAGYAYTLNSQMELKPSLFVKNDGANTSVDINALMEYNNRFWGGVNYRLSESAALLMGMHLNESLRFGVAYDVPMTDVSTAGSVEFMLGYCFKVDYNKVVKGFKNPRFL